jgi:uncharacterized protein with HEPN domain
MSHSDDSVRLHHILDAARKAQAILNGRSLEELAHDEIGNLALERLLEIIGEAANRVGPSTMAGLGELPWRDMIDMRNVIIHAYPDVELETVWRTVVEDLPSLVDTLGRYLEDVQGDVT